MQVYEAHDRTGAHTACPCLLDAQPGPATAQSLLYPSSWTHGSYMQRHTGTHSSMRPHTHSKPTPKQMCPDTTCRAGLIDHTSAPPSISLCMCTPPLPTPLLSLLPPPAATGTSAPSPSPPLTALCCSDTGFNKFALVVTSRMWPWGGECPAAPDFTCLYVNHGHGLHQTFEYNFPTSTPVVEEVSGPGPPPWH